LEIRKKIYLSDILLNETKYKKRKLLHCEKAIEKWALDEFRSTNLQIEWVLMQALKEAKRNPKNKKELRIDFLLKKEYFRVLTTPP
jgi:hypothetical protein